MLGSYEPCLCGAPDCPSCFPENFHVINGRRVFVADKTDEQIKALEDYVPYDVDYESA